jgi:hypothetical protein
VPFVKGASRVLREPEVFAVCDRNGERVYIEVPAGVRVRLHATTLPDFGDELPIPDELATA